MKRLRFAAAAIAACLLTSPAAPAADGPAELRWKFEKDKPIYEEVTTQTKSTLKVMGNDLTQTIGGNLNNWGVGGQIGFEY